MQSQFPDGMDKECVSLCESVNLLLGIETCESCCGHGEHEFRIWFEAEDLEDLPSLLYWLDSCHCGFRGWLVIATTDCAMRPVIFLIEGPIGEQAYTEADEIAGLITGWVEEMEKEEGDS